ncbi:RTA1-domain-containing protein [Lindgomyces ingoldianus]|uniref:RTA1-domain-containing protein n=1 Tax=Lindgomyces ingoldianus TaxID=673940 RepID=A0ACB6QLR9_9PLEO|nr:RTA1-domain-containing protein [Lindgomyces ingoldianus]KAF2467091.1 RTA1-domain-containing protein [Lindgomyces ingoldianus]
MRNLPQTANQIPPWFAMLELDERHNLAFFALECSFLGLVVLGEFLVYVWRFWSLWMGLNVSGFGALWGDDERGRRRLGRGVPQEKRDDLITKISLFTRSPKVVSIKTQETMASDESIWMFSCSTALAIVVSIFYLIPTLVLTWQTFIKYRSWFFLCVLIGSALEVGGYIARAVSSKQVSSIPPYAISSTLIIIAPVFVAAGNYLLIGRLIRAVLHPSHHRIFGIPAHLITKTFVGCDILSFLIQASGSGIASSGSWEGNTAKIGTNVLIGGLSTQVATFVWFLAIVMRFWSHTHAEVKPDAPRGWFRVLQAIWISSCLILVRSIYRVIEFALGINGYPFTHEWIFYVFEALPMLPAISVFCFVHPAKYLGRTGGLEGKVEESRMELALSIVYSCLKDTKQTAPPLKTRS